MALRKLLKQRSDLAQVTVNDVLLLYRGLHALLYTPSPALQQAIDALTGDRHADARQAHQIIQEEQVRLQGKNPAILIPLDASRYDPRERVFPTTFRNPLTDFYHYHTHCLNALHAYRAAPKGGRSTVFQEFYEAQLTYLRLIGGFGELLTRYRNIALAGQSRLPERAGRAIAIALVFMSGADGQRRIQLEGHVRGSVSRNGLGANRIVRAVPGFRCLRRT